LTCFRGSRTCSLRRSCHRLGGTENRHERKQE
jgi:hypothetical protein